jgi:hypothetical protein
MYIKVLQMLINAENWKILVTFAAISKKISLLKLI